MTRTEFALVIALALALPAVAGLPLLAARDAARDAGDAWTGQFPSRDHAQYAALVAQARETPVLLFRNPYADDARRAIPGLSLTLAGLLSSASDNPPPAAITAVGLVSAALLGAAVWWLVSLCLPAGRTRSVGILLVVLSGGVAFFVARLAPIWPSLLERRTDLDYWAGWSVFGALHNPVWTTALLLVFASLAAALAADRDARPARLIVLALLACALEPTHVWLGGGTLAVLWVFAATSPRRFRLGLALLPGSVLAAAHVLSVLGDRAGGPASGALRNATPSLLSLAGGFGLLLPLGVAGAILLIRRPGPARRLLLAWVATALVLLENPYVAGVKFVTLLQPALALLATIALAALWTRRRVVAPVLATVLTLALVSSAPQILRVQVTDARALAECRIAPGEVEVLAALDPDTDGPLLCEPVVGTRLPWLANRRPFLGHWFLTPAFGRRLRAARAAFAADATDEATLAFLDEESIAAVLIRHRDRDLFARPPPAPFVAVARRGECVLYVRETP